MRLQKIIIVLVLLCNFESSVLAHEKDEIKADRSPKNIGTVLVFAGTGWYRHPETAAINGWLARLSDDIGMQIDISETPKDITTILDHYDVLIFNNSNELTKLFDKQQQQKIENWYPVTKRNVIKVFDVSRLFKYYSFSSFLCINC